MYCGRSNTAKNYCHKELHLRCCSILDPSPHLFRREFLKLESSLNKVLCNRMFPQEFSKNLRKILFAEKLQMTASETHISWWHNFLKVIWQIIHPTLQLQWIFEEYFLELLFMAAVFCEFRTYFQNIFQSKHFCFCVASVIRIFLLLYWFFSIWWVSFFCPL